MRRFLGLLAAVVLAAGIAAPISAEPTTIRVSRQPGLLYLPMMIIEDQKLLEAEARKHGLGEITVQWMTFNSGGAGVDAVLSGNVDFVMSGATNLLVVWDKTHGGVKGVVGGGALPMLLVTRNPNVHSLKDFGPSDKIAVPTVRVSTQATILDAAAQKASGIRASSTTSPSRSDIPTRSSRSRAGRRSTRTSRSRRIRKKSSSSPASTRC